MNDLLLALLAALTGSGVSSIIVVLLQRKWAKQDQHDERVDALVDATKVQMIDRVRWLGRGYIESGEIRLEDKENIKEMYAAYKRLGGNGHLDTIMSEIDHLKVI